MTKKYFLIVVLVALVCMFVMNGFVYAAERRAEPYGHGRHLGPNGHAQPNSTQIPEPSTLILLGTGLTGIGVYLYSRRKDKK